MGTPSTTSRYAVDTFILNFEIYIMERKRERETIWKGKY
jgi:hypothetical protein